MKKISVSTKLSIVYTILGILFILCLAFTFYKYNKSNIYKENINNLQQISESIMVKIDGRLANIDQVSIEVLSNNDFINKWEKIINHYESEDLIEIRSQLHEIIMKSYMGKPDIRRVAVFSKDGYYICTGKSDVPRSKLLRRIEQIDGIEKMNYVNSRLFLSPHEDFWDSNSEGIVISEIKPIKNKEKEIIGYLEVQQNQFYIADICDVKFNGSKLDTMVFMGDNESLFYTNIDQEKRNNGLIEEIREVTKQYSKVKDNDHQVIFTTSSNYYQGYTVCVLEKKIIYKSLRNIAGGIIILVITLIIITIGYSILATKLIMKPISLLVNQMEHADLFDFNNRLDLKVTDRETQILVNSFEQMTQRFQKSFLEEKQLEDLQTKTLFSVLQSQISPHFLYNTLGSIANMCEMEETQAAADACYSLTEILRYSSNYATREVRIAEEIDNLKSYLHIMKSRYRQRLDYEINIDNQVKYFMLPKLTYQPIVENAIKYSLLEQEQVIIKVNTILVGQDLIIEITDNGCGITKETREDIAYQIKMFKEDKTHLEKIQNIKIGGMGLVGTLTRLFIFFGEDFQYELLKNNNGKGTTVVLKINIDKYR